jgi:hypothetical protein
VLRASRTCAAVLTRAPEPSVARLTVMSSPATATVSGRLAAPGSTTSIVMSFPPSWPHSTESTPTRAAFDTGMPGISVPLAGRLCFSRVPASSEIMTVGIENVPLPPGLVGAPGTLFTSTTAIAPAAWAFCVFSTNGHVPRSTSAMAPAGNPTSGPHPSDGRAPPALTTANEPANPADGTPGPLFAEANTYSPAAAEGGSTTSRFEGGSSSACALRR